MDLDQLCSFINDERVMDRIEDKPFQCVCRKKFVTAIGLYKHEFVCNLMTYICTICGKSWPNNMSKYSKQIKEHLSEHHAEGYAKEDLYEAILKQAADIKADQRKFFRLNGSNDEFNLLDTMYLLRCTRCEISLQVGKEKLKNKIKDTCYNCQEPYKYECSVCHKLYPIRNSLLTHLRNKCFATIYICNNCEFTTRTKETILKHKRKIVPRQPCIYSLRQKTDSMIRINCGICGNSWEVIREGKKTNLYDKCLQCTANAHIYECVNCKFRTINYNSLRKHIRDEICKKN